MKESAFLPQNRRFKNRRWFFWFFGVFVAAIILIILLGYLIFWSGVFDVKNFSYINQDNIVLNKEVRLFLISEGVKHSRISKFFTPDNILFWSGIFWRDFSPPPFLVKLSFHPDYQKRNVVIETIKRNPFGLLCSKATSGCFWFDNEGVLFASASAAEGFLIPKVFDENKFTPALSPETLFYVKELARLPTVTPMETIIKENILEEIEVKTLKGPKLYFSLKFTIDNLSEILNKLNKEVKLASLEYIDFRVPGRIFYR